MRGKQETINSIKTTNRKATIVVLIIFLAFLSSLFFAHWYFFTTEINKSKSKDEPLYFSILFIDENDESYGAFIGVLSSLHSRVSFIGIPNNMGLWKNKNNLPISLADHYKTAGQRDVFSAIENTFEKKLTYKITINNEGIANIIDLLGGIRMYIEEPINYVNEEKSHYLQVDIGEYFFTSDKVLAYINYLTMEGYKARETLYKLEDILMNTFIKFIQEPTLREAIISNGLLKKMSESIDSNLRLIDLKAIAKIMSLSTQSSFIIESLDGNINNYGVLEPILEGRVAIRQIDELALYTGLKTEKSRVSNEDVNLIVLNATGIGGLADSINIRMRYRGFLAGEYGNFPVNIPNSVVLVRGGQLEKSFLVANEGKITRIYSKTDRRVLNDTVMILGDDYYEIKR